MLDEDRSRLARLLGLAVEGLGRTLVVGTVAALAVCGIVSGSIGVAGATCLGIRRQYWHDLAVVSKDIASPLVELPQVHAVSTSWIIVTLSINPAQLAGRAVKITVATRYTGVWFRSAYFLTHLCSFSLGKAGWRKPVRVVSLADRDVWQDFIAGA